MSPVGASTTARREDLPLITGAGCFVGDVRRPGQLWASVVRSQQAHACVLAVDPSRAWASAGVVAVLTADDLRRDCGGVPVLPVRLLEDERMRRRRQPVLATDRVRYVGEPIALVVAEDPYLAEDAAELVDVSLEPRPAAVRAARDEPALWDDGGDNELVRWSGCHGDVEEAFAKAAAVVDVDLAVQRHTGLPMETRGLVAEWSGDGRLHLWGVTKYVHFTRRAVARALGLDADAVVVHRVDVGGMFGVRGELYPEDVIVPWAARRLGRPVGWVEDRREHFVATNHSREQRHHVRLAVSHDGRLLALRDRVVVDVGAYPRPIGGRYVQLVPEYLPGPYRWEGLDIEARGVATTKTPVGTMRAPVAFETTFVRERAIDVAAHRLGLDPVELRLRSLVRPQEQPYVTDLGGGIPPIRLESGDGPAVVQAVLDHVDLRRVREQVRARRERGEIVGVGVAVFAESTGGGVRETVRLELDTTGRFVLGTSAAEIGQGLASMAARVLAERLGVTEDDVVVLAGDSRAHGGGGGTFGSRTTMFVGSAAADAATLMLEVTRIEAAEQLGVQPAALTLTADGYATGDGRYVRFKELAPLSVEGQHEMPEAAIGVGAHVAVASVDGATGIVRVERLVVGYDCGRAIDPESVRGQLVGGSVQGLGGALLEELVYDADGQPQTTTLVDYLIPTAGDAPDVEALVLQTVPAAGNPLGARGAGEAGVVGVAAAVANAVADALGGDLEDLALLPLAPERVWSLLQKRNAARTSSTRGRTKEGVGDI